MTRLTIRFDFDDNHRIGPGKIALLEAIARDGAIAIAAKSLGMSYRRAWLLVEAMNGMFRDPVVESGRGGRRGGGAILTPFGCEVVERYRRTEQSLQRTARRDTQFLEKRLAHPPASG